MGKEPHPYHRDNLEAELLLRASEIISAQGVDALSLRGLGQSASVSRTAPYHYFQSKADLLDRIGARGFAHLAESIENEAKGVTAPTSRVIAGFRGYLLFAKRQPAIFGLMFADKLVRSRDARSSEGVDFPFSSGNARRAFSLLLDAVGALPSMAASNLPDRLRLTNMLWAYAHGVSALELGENLKGIEAQELLERGLQALLSHTSSSR